MLFLFVLFARLFSLLSSLCDSFAQLVGLGVSFVFHIDVAFFILFTPRCDNFMRLIRHLSVFEGRVSGLGTVLRTF